MGCGDAISEDDSNVTGASVTAGTYSDPVCNGGFRDGVCNALGGDPESCMCLDCAETAYCLGKCNDNGTCEASERDVNGDGDPRPNQTCRDCFQGGTNAPSSSAAEGTTDATTDASNASTDATDAASSDAATTNDAPSSSAAGGGGGGGGV